MSLRVVWGDEWAYHEAHPNVLYHFRKGFVWLARWGGVLGVNRQSPLSVGSTRIAWNDLVETTCIAWNEL